MAPHGYHESYEYFIDPCFHFWGVLVAPCLCNYFLVRGPGHKGQPADNAQFGLLCIGQNPISSVFNILCIQEPRPTLSKHFNLVAISYNWTGCQTVKQSITPDKAIYQYVATRCPHRKDQLCISAFFFFFFSHEKVGAARKCRVCALGCKRVLTGTTNCPNGEMMKTTQWRKGPRDYGRS